MTDKERIEVYVDSLPKCCRQCPCCNCEYESRLTCNLGTFDDEYYLQHISMLDKKRHRDCPLKTIQSVQNQRAVEALERLKNYSNKETDIGWGIIKQCSASDIKNKIDELIKEYGGEEG